ncbi:MAG: CTP synthetase [Salinirussus sp.]
MTIVVAGIDEHHLADALEERGVSVERVDIANRNALAAAGVDGAEAYVLTEVEQATSIAVVRELAPDVRIVVYADGSLPDFARGQADILLDPDLFEPQTVAAELS